MTSFTVRCRGEILALLIACLVTGFVHGEAPRHRNTDFARLFRTPREVEKRPVPDAIASLISDEVEQRLLAIEALNLSRAVDSQALLKTLRIATRERPDRHCLGRFNVVLSAVRTNRVEEAIPLLVPLLDFTLDPKSLPIGVTFGDAAYYPVADAVATIGGPRMFQELTESLKQPVNELRLRVTAWVLHENLGEWGAIGYTEALLRDTRLTKMQVEQYKAISLLLKDLQDRKRGLLILPVEPSRSPAPNTDKKTTDK